MVLLCRWLANRPADWTGGFRSLTSPVWYSLFSVRVTLADLILVQPRRLSVKVKRRFSVDRPRLTGQGPGRSLPTERGHWPRSLERLADRASRRTARRADRAASVYVAGRKQVTSVIGRNARAGISSPSRTRAVPSYITRPRPLPAAPRSACGPQRQGRHWCSRDRHTPSPPARPRSGALRCGPRALGHERRPRPCW